MAMKKHTRLDLVEGGNIFKQGDYVTLGFIPRDYTGASVDLTNKQIEGSIFNGSTGVIYEGPASFVDGKIFFTIKQVLNDGKFQLEFTVTDAADPEYRTKFPTDDYASELTIKPSADNLDYVGVSMTTVAQLRTEQEQKQQQFELAIVPQVDELKQRVEEGIGAFTEDTEVKDARMDEINLRTFNQKVVAQLDEKLNQGEVTVSDIDKNQGLFDQTYFSDEVKQQWAGNTPINAVPADRSLVTGKFADEAVDNTKLKENITKYLPTALNDYVWELGGMYLGNDQASTTRMRTRNGEYVRLYAGDIITVGTNYQVLLTLFNSNRSYVSDTGWKTNTFTVLTSGIYRLAVQKTAVSDFTQSELANLPASFKLRRMNWDTNNFVKTETIDNEKLKPVVNRHLHYNLKDLEWEHGAIFNGGDTPGTNRMRTKAGQYVYLEPGDVVRVGVNKNIVPVCYNKFGEFIGASIANWNPQEHIVTMSGYYRFVVEKGNAPNFTQKEIELYPKNFVLKKKAVKQLHEAAALKTQIELILPSTTILSDPSVETMTHASMIYADTFSNDGTVWGAYYANDTATIESPSNTGTYINLIKFNLLDPSNVRKIEAVRVGVAVGGYTITGRAPYDPNLVIKQNSITLVFNSYIDGKVTLGTLEFDKQTETFSNYQTSQLTYEVEGVTETVDLDVVGLRSAYEAMTGDTLTGDLEDLCVSTTFVEHNGYKYNTACQIFYDVGFKGMIIRTLDGINYEVVAIPKSAPASAIESTIEIVGDKIIYAQRGGLHYISAYHMTSGLWDEWITIPDMTSSKNALMYINGKLLLAYTSGNQLTTDWGKIQRSGFSIKEVNPETLEMKNVVDFRSPFGIHYPCLMKWKGSLYMSYSEDRKKLDLSQARSNISIMPLNLA